MFLGSQGQVISKDANAGGSAMFLLRSAQERAMEGEERQDDPASAEAPPKVVSQADFDAARDRLDAFLVTCADIHDHGLQQRLWDEAKRIHEEDEGASSVFRLLSSMMSMHAQPENDAEPFRPMWEMRETRSMKPSDLHGEQNAIIGAIAADMPHPMLRARLGDVSFHNDRRQGRAARAAMEAYCHLARRHVAGEIEQQFPDLDRTMHEALEMMTRALALMSRTEKKGQVAESVRGAFDVCHAATVERSDLFGFVEFSELGLGYRLIEPSDVARVAEQLAVAAPVGTYAEMLRRLWALAARCHAMAGDEPEEMRCLMERAEATLRMRDDCGQASAKAHWTMAAIGEMRQVSGSVDRVRVLRDELRQLQGAAQDEVVSHKWSMDLGEMQAATAELFQEAPLGKALALLIEMAAPPSVAELRKIVLEQAKKHPLGNLFASVHVDGQGREVARVDALNLDAEPDDVWYRAEAVKHMEFVLVEHVNGRIEPARRTLLTRFAIAERHVAPIVVNSPFIPAGRVEIMAVGLVRMIQGDYLTACHLLFPQLENILRHILVTHGEDPSKIEPDLLQGDRALGALLDVDRPRLTEILGEDAVHLIDIVFNFRPGPSLRNELAHGKLGWGAFHSPYAIYGCWFILWLVVLPLRRYWKDEVAPLIEQAV